MIPYFEWRYIQIGPINLYVWGVFVALGFLLAAYVAGRMVENKGGEKKIMYDLTAWMMASGILGGRLGYVFFYNPADFITDPVSAFRIWDGGMSFFGGLILSLIVGFWYLKKKRVDIWKYADSAMFGIPFGLWIGRIGCFMIHAHVGKETNFFLGVQYPDGIVRHDLGLYLSINGLVMGIVFLLLSRKKRSEGFYFATFALWYGIVRFLSDFLRTGDTTYYGLTPAQYLSVILFIYGMWYFIKQIKTLKEKYGRKK